MNVYGCLQVVAEIPLGKIKISHSYTLYKQNYLPNCTVCVSCSSEEQTVDLTHSKVRKIEAKEAKDSRGAHPPNGINEARLRRLPRSVAFYTRYDVAARPTEIS